MKKYLFYVMEGKKMCFLHSLMNALQMVEEGFDVKIILEGQAVTLPKELVTGKNALFKKVMDKELIEGICLACSKKLGSYDDNVGLGFKMLDDMNGHAGMMPYINQGYEVLVF